MIPPPAENCKGRADGMVKEKKLEILAVRGNFSAERSVCIPREHSERKSIHHEEIFDPGAVGAADDGPADRLRRQDYGQDCGSDGLLQHPGGGVRLGGGRRLQRRRGHHDDELGGRHAGGLPWWSARPIWWTAATTPSCISGSERRQRPCPNDTQDFSQRCSASFWGG